MPKKGARRNLKAEVKKNEEPIEEEKPDMLMDASISQARKGAKYSPSLQKLVDLEKGRLMPGVGAIQLVGCVEAREVQAKYSDEIDNFPRSFYNYLLLDPIELSDGPHACDFPGFIASIFYGGKGTGSRPHDHLRQAIEVGEKKRKRSGKTDHIQDIWERGHGVYIFQLNQNITSHESLAVEYCILEALGISNLMNKYRGTKNYLPDGWRVKKARDFGTLLLFNAWNVFKLSNVKSLKEVHVKPAYVPPFDTKINP
uniref:GIY-YIG domain-containing protein n=1 Tax=Ditylenchus dipsaci TaxID=166011 RepID=A0A915DD11_9BILA